MRSQEAARVVEVAASASAAPERVWAVLADPWSYSRWVSGTARIRGADPGWPAVGSRLRHSFGPWPARVRDETTVLASDPPRRLALSARAGPFGRVRAELLISPRPGGARIVLRQHLRGGPGAVLARLGHAVQLRRNRRSLRNLITLCETGRR